MSTYPRGTQVGPYEIVALLPSGKGGMGAVYLARPRANYAASSPSLVALKMAYGSHNDFLKYEVEHMSRLSHPNILRVLPIPTAGTNLGRPVYIAKSEPDNPNSPFYIAVEYMRGGSVEQLLQRRGHLSPSEAVEIASQIAVALIHIHNSQIVHLDIKDSNILLREPLSRWEKRRPQVVVSDFGIAWSTERRQLSTVYGSQLYTAPERAAGSAPHPQNDIFSLGVLLYQMLVGRHPFTSVVVPGTQIMEHSRPSILNRAISPELEQVILRAMATDPAQRYQTVQQLHTDLERLPGMVRPGQVRLPLLQGAHEYLITGLSGMAVLLLGGLGLIAITPPPIIPTPTTGTPTVVAPATPSTLSPTAIPGLRATADASTPTRPTSTVLAVSTSPSPVGTLSVTASPGRTATPDNAGTTAVTSPSRATSTTLPPTPTPSPTRTARPSPTPPPPPPTVPPPTETPPPPPTETPPPPPTEAPPPPPIEAPPSPTEVPKPTVPAEG